MQNPQEPAEDGQGNGVLSAEIDGKIDEVVRALRCAVNARVGLDCSFAEREQATLSIGNEAQRCLLEQELQSIAEAQGRELLINETLYREHRPGRGDYASLCGPLQIQRSTYRLAGVRNGPTAVPLGLQAGLMEGATPAMAYRVALSYAKVHSRSLEEDLRASHRRAAGISVGLDRTAVPMEEVRRDGAPPKSQRKKRIKPSVRIPPAPVDVNYPMAYLGTVSITDRYGDGLVTRRYAASPNEGSDEVLHGMMTDVRNALRRNRSLRVGIVQDGEPEMWNLVRAALTQAGVTSWLEAIDRYHLNERLAKVPKVIEPDPDARKPQLHRWNDELDTDDSTIDHIEERVGCEIRDRDGIDDLTVLQDNATFIGNNKDRMRCVSLREASLPVGSGATEGACRSVIGERAKRASRRWHEEGLVAALALRSIYCSDRLPRFFTYLQRHYTAEIREADWEEDAAA